MFTRILAAFALVFALSVLAPAAFAQRVLIDLPAGTLADGIVKLSAQTGVSIGASGPLPARTIPAVRGRIDINEALSRMLAGSGWRAHRLTGRIWRIEPVYAPGPARRTAAIPPRQPFATAPAPAPDPDIVVTGRKRVELLGSADAAIMVVPGVRIDSRGAPMGSEMLATMIDGLTVTSLGSGRNRLFVRGVADSPFDGFGEASVGVVIDDARVTYDAPDPDLKLIDIDRVELLKGPQGPLYGSGALGGIYRVVTRKADLGQWEGSAAGGIDLVSHGGIGAHVQGMLNLPIVADVSAVRFVAYQTIEPGWINTTGGASNINRSMVSGGRLAVRVLPAGGWTVDLGGVLQAISARDSRYVDGSATYARSTRAREPHDVDFALGSATVAGQLGSLALTSVTSMSTQELQATYDSSASAVALGASVPAQYFDDRHYRVVNQEVRLASPAGGGLTWLAGLSFLDAATDASGQLTDRSGTRQILTLRRRVQEIAGFGEATVNWSGRLSATLGGRLFRSDLRDEKHESGKDGVIKRQKLHFAPSASLHWHDDAGHSLFARYAGSLRSGGAEANSAGSPDGSYGPDEISTGEIGARLQGRRLSVSVGTFLSYWSNVQADFLSSNGLVTTRNVGNAIDKGVEVSVDWRPEPRLAIAAGLIAHRGRLEHLNTTTAVGDDLRLPIAPDVTVRGSIDRRLDLGEWTVHAGLRANYVGSARLSFDPGLDRRIPARVGFGLGFTAERANWSLHLDADNLLDDSADSFGFGNPFSIRANPQRTPIRPRSLSLTIGRRF
ncbi:N/A [soil metagenome]